MKIFRYTVVFVFTLVLNFFSSSMNGQSVVINKYWNAGTNSDIVELLVVQDNADLRYMWVKDFSASNVNDGGGGYQFSSNSMWQSVRAGTLIVLRRGASTTDVTVSCSDYVLDIDFSNTTYFINANSNFDIASTDMVMLKSGTSSGGAAERSGTNNNIHTLRAGAAAAQWTPITGPRNGTTSNAATAQFCYVNNATSTLADFNQPTTGCTVGTGLTWGAGNNASNTTFINFLRGPVNLVSSLATGSGFTLNWSSLSTANAYFLEVDNNSNFASPEINGLNVGNVLTYTITTLSPSTTYYYRLRATNAAGTSSAKSCAGNITTSSSATLGCTNPVACNYNSTATQDNGTCTFATTWYLDTDSDGYGVSTSTISACTNPGGYASVSGDCNNSNASIHPGILENAANNNLCDGIDNDCDTAVDEGQISGCTDINASNYNVAATCLTTCTYPQFSVGNLVVTRVGTGSAALSSVATPLYIEQYSPTTPGSAVTAFQLPQTGSNKTMVSGSATSEGFISRSANGLSVVIGAYSANAGTAGITTSTASAVPRIVGEFTSAYSYSVPFISTSFHSGNNIRSATKAGNSFWSVGSAGGVNFYGTGSPSNVSSSPDNNRVVRSDNGQLYFSSGSTSPGPVGIWRVGTGLPTTSGQTSVSVINTGTGSSPYDFDFNDAGTICYVADDRTTGGGVMKFTFNGSTWTLTSTFNLGSGWGASGLYVDWYTGAQPIIFAISRNTTNGTRLVRFSDTGVATPTLLVLATAPTNTAFRGVELAPCAELLWYKDADSDGYGDAAQVISFCTQPLGYVSAAGDCNDADPTINPGATEICNGIDDNCDTFSDEGLLSSFYEDADGDGFGNAAVIEHACSAPAGYVADNTDCDDTNTSIHPAGSEICENNADDDCDGQINEGCSSALIVDLPSSASLIAYSTNIVYPTCYPISGTCANASDSPQSITYSGPDIWYRFVAYSPAVTITLNSSTMDDAIELYSRTGNSYNLMPGGAENSSSGVSDFERLNYNGLTIGQTYYVSVGAASGSTGGAFTLCVQHLMPSGCAYTVPANGFALCAAYKAIYRGSAAQGVTYNFNFTGVGNGASGTTSITATNGLIPLSSTSLALRYGGVYDVSVDAVYSLQDGMGNFDIITVPGSSTSANCSTVTMNTQPRLEVKSSQRCPATLFRSSYLIGTPVAGEQSSCGATSYTYEFTQVTDCTGSNAVGLPYEVTTGGSTPYLGLANAFPSSLPNAGYYKVRLHPNFSYGPGTYGTAPYWVIRVNNSTASTMEEEGMTEDNEKTLSGETPSALLYPNPTNGKSIHLNMTDVDGDVFVRITDQAGRIVFNDKFVSESSLNTEIQFAHTLSNGLYAVEITSGAERLVRVIAVGE